MMWISIVRWFQASLIYCESIFIIQHPRRRIVETTNNKYIRATSTGSRGVHTEHTAYLHCVIMPSCIMMQQQTTSISNYTPSLMTETHQLPSLPQPSCLKSSNSTSMKPIPMLLNELCQRKGWSSPVYVDMLPEEHLPPLHTLTGEPMTNHPLYKSRRCKVHEANIFGEGCPRYAQCSRPHLFC
jgi:hypothetical protein